jgi:thymidylate synthase (FAD)
MLISKQEVALIDHMGSDLSVVNAARVSFHKVAEEFTDKDVKLIDYLAKHNHWTPFAHTSLSFRIKAPIFVARQLGKHQVGLVWNEVSRRYVDDNPEFYLPDTFRKKAGSVKQGSDKDPIEDSNKWLRYAAAHNEECLSLYNDALDAGMCAEQARMFLPQNMMTEWIWTGSLAAFARVCHLRLDPHTQLETQQIATLLSRELERTFPASYAALSKTTGE